MSKIMEDLTGQKFNNLLVIETFRKNQKTYCKCICDCGKETIVEKPNLKNGTTKSCGCLSRINSANRLRTHGLTKSRLYRIWDGIKTRCYRTNAKGYKNYGRRGIYMCDEWKNDFQTFYDWAMNNGYNDKLTIDRIDNNGDYEPSNCRWADKKTQQNNTRWNHQITYNGTTHSISEWATILGVNYQMLYSRIKRGKEICHA